MPLSSGEQQTNSETLGGTTSQQQQQHHQTSQKTHQNVPVPPTPKTPSGTSGRKVGFARPTLIIPPPSGHFDSPRTAISNHTASLTVPNTGTSAANSHLYGRKASGFMFDQFNGIRNYAKSGLGAGEKSAYWLYSKVRRWSRKWFTHMFLSIVIILYTVGGALIFVAVEGSNESKVVEVDLRNARYDLIYSLGNLTLVTRIEKSLGEWKGESYQKVIQFEETLIQAYEKHKLIVSSQKKVWTFWNTIVYCGTIYTTIGSTKVALMLYFRKEIWNYLKELETGECTPDFKRGGVTEFTLVKSAISFTHKHLMMFNGICIAIFGSLGIYNYKINFPHSELEANMTDILAPTSKILPLNTWFPFDLTKTNLYIVGFSYQYVAILHLAVYISSFDVLCCGIMIHVKAQYRILKNSLRTLVERSQKDYLDLSNFGRVNSYLQSLNGDDDFKNSNQFLEQTWINIRRCIVHHQKILKLSVDAENAFNYLMLFQSISSLMMICLSLFQLSLTQFGSLAFVSMFSFLMLMVFQVFIFCYCGEQVLIQTETLCFAIYECNWLILDNKQKKILMQMMMRAQRPFRFTAGKFVFLSMETFMKIVKGSASYFTVLQSVSL